MSRGLTGKTLGNLGWTLSGSGAQVVLQIAVTAVLARLLTPADFGIIALAIAATGAGQFLQFGLGPALVQRAEITRLHKEAVFSSAIALSIGIMLVMWMLAPWIELYIVMPGLASALRVCSLIFFFRGLASVGDALLQRDMQFRRLASINFVSYTFGFAFVGVVLGVLNTGYWALVLAYVGQSAVRTVLVLWTSRAIFPPRFHISAIRELLPFGTGISLGNVISYIGSQADYVIVGKIFGPAVLGIYSRAFKLMVMPANLFTQSVDRVMFPTLASIQTNENRLRIAFRRGVLITAITIIPVSLLAIVLAPELVGVLLGPQWGAAVVPLQILSVSMFCRVGLKIGDILARAKGELFAMNVVKIWSASLIVVLALLGSRYGLNGVCIGVAAALALAYAGCSYLGMRVSGLPLSELLLAHWPGVAGGALVAGAALPVAMSLRLVESPPLVTLICTCGAAGLVTTGTMFLLRHHLRQLDVAWIVDAVRPLWEGFRARPAPTSGG